MAAYDLARCCWVTGNVRRLTGFATEAQLAAVKVESLLNIASVATFLQVTEEDVLRLLEEGRLGGSLIAVSNHKGIPVIPGMKNTVEKVVSTLSLALLKPPSQPETSSGSGAEATATIMFTDIVGSASLIQTLGDRRAREIMREHDEIIRRDTSTFGGKEVKSLGDGFMLSFPSSRRGVACAIAVQRRLAGGMEAANSAQLAVRIGLSVGEPIQEQDDLFGSAVVMAARISAQAQGGQILVSQIVHALLSATGEFSFKEAGRFQLKGISGRHCLYEVLWRPS